MNCHCGECVSCRSSPKGSAIVNWTLEGKTVKVFYSNGQVLVYTLAVNEMNPTLIFPMIINGNTYPVGTPLETVLNVFNISSGNIPLTITNNASPFLWDSLTQTLNIPPTPTLTNVGDIYTFNPNNGTPPTTFQIPTVVGIFVRDAPLIGIVNDINTVFTLAHTPVVKSLEIYLNGQYLKENVDFFVVANQVTFVHPLFTTDILTVNYTYI